MQGRHKGEADAHIHTFISIHACTYIFIHFHSSEAGGTLGVTIVLNKKNYDVNDQIISKCFFYYLEPCIYNFQVNEDQIFLHLSPL